MYIIAFACFTDVVHNNTTNKNDFLSNLDSSCWLKAKSKRLLPLYLSLFLLANNNV